MVTLSRISLFLSPPPPPPVRSFIFNSNRNGSLSHAWKQFQVKIIPSQLTVLIYVFPRLSVGFQIRSVFYPTHPLRPPSLPSYSSLPLSIPTLCLRPSSIIFSPSLLHTPRLQFPPHFPQSLSSPLSNSDVFVSAWICLYNQCMCGTLIPSVPPPSHTPPGLPSPPQSTISTGFTLISFLPTSKSYREKFRLPTD